MKNLVGRPVEIVTKRGWFFHGVIKEVTDEYVLMYDIKKGDHYQRRDTIAEINDLTNDPRGQLMMAQKTEDTIFSRIKTNIKKDVPFLPPEYVKNVEKNIKEDKPFLKKK